MTEQSIQDGTLEMRSNGLNFTLSHRLFPLETVMVSRELLLSGP